MLSPSNFISSSQTSGANVAAVAVRVSHSSSVSWPIEQQNEDHKHVDILLFYISSLTQTCNIIENDHFYSNEMSFVLRRSPRTKAELDKDENVKGFHQYYSPLTCLSAQQSHHYNNSYFKRVPKEM